MPPDATGSGPSPEQAFAVAAAASSHQSWTAAGAAAAGGDAARRNGGLVAYGPDPERGGWIGVMFVERPEQHPAEIADEVTARLPSLPALRSVGWWTTTPDENVVLGTTLLARGFQWGWQPHWMWLDPAWPRPTFALPSGIRLACFPDDDGDVRLPAAVRAFGERRRPLTRLHPTSTPVFAAFEGDEVVGSITLHVGESEVRPLVAGGHPIAGIYDCWVIPQAQRRGIGAALTAAAVERASSLGCKVVTLNATQQGERMYRRVGFRSAGWGQTWWMVERQLRGVRPTDAQTRLVEAIGRSDDAAIDEALRELRTRDGGVDLEVELPCAETPLGVAVRLKQDAAARRLIHHGAHLSVVTAWDLGWRDEAADMLRREPAAADERIGARGATPLMIAVERDDEALAQLVMAAGPDLSLRDREYGADALGWAEHFGRTTTAERIRSMGARSKEQPGAAKR